MQSDQTLDKSLTSNSAWGKDEITGKSEKEMNRFAVPSLQRAKMSFSGHERNHLFMNQEGKSFQDVSGISGLDTDADGRSFAVVDFDRDGWQDIVLANVTSPTVSFYRNQLAEADSNSEHQFLVVDCVGGNTTAAPTTSFSPRDGFGVKVTVKTGDAVYVREKRGGEGLAAQNSQLLHFGLGRKRSVDEIEIKWPSGIVQKVQDIHAGHLIRCYEDLSKSKSGSGVDVEKLPEKSFPNNLPNKDKVKVFDPPVNGSAKFKMFVSMATWCPNCKKHIPQLRLIRQRFGESELQIVGVPVDGADTSSKLSEYLVENNPPYQIDGKWDTPHRDMFNRLASENLESSSLPTTIITDSNGQVLDIFRGVATVSKLSKLGANSKPIGE